MQVSQSGARPAVSRLLLRSLLVTSAMIGTGVAQQAAAQNRVVSACSGVQLPRSAVTQIVAPVLTGITAPIETTVNGILGLPLVGAVLPPLNTNVTGLLNQAASGAPITLQVLDIDGNIVGPTDQCQLTSDTISLDTPGGISIGGNRIAGLGAAGTPSFAADINAIAFGNNARAEAGAAGSIAFGTNSSVTAANSVALGAGSVAARGAQAGYAAIGLATPQTSAGEISVGTAGGLRQITNVAAGSAPTDAATVGQVTGVADQVAALASGAIQYDDATRARATLGGIGGTVLGNVGAGAVTATSTDAVNGSQLFATNTQVGANTAAIGALDTRVATNTTAIGALDTRVTTNTTDIATLQGQAASAIRYDTDAAGVRTGVITLAGATPGATATLTNVAPGALTATSTDAVNGSQLFATNTQVGTNTAAIGALDTRVATNTTAIGGLDTRIATNATAIGALDTRVTTNTTDIATLQGQAANAIRYDTDAAGVRTGGVTLVGVTPGTAVTLGNVAPGALTATSTDAVNGSQLFATNTQVGTNTAAIGALDTRVATNTTAIGALDARVTTNTTDIAALQGSSLNAVRYDVDAAGVRTGGLTLVGAVPGQAVTLGNVAAGTVAAGSTEAVNGGQLFDTNQRLDGAVGSIAALDTRVAANTTGLAALGAIAAQYDSATRDRLTLAGPSGTVLANVAAGTLSATSTEAVNGSQLFATNAQLAAQATLLAQMGNGAMGPVQYASAGAPTTPNGGTVTDDLTLVGASGGAVALHNVAGGAVGAGSTDAVNGGQLFDTNQAVAGLDTRVTANTTQIAANTTAITDLQNNVAGTGAAVTNLTTRVDANSTAITNLATQVANQPLKYADAGTPTVPNAGTLTDDATLVGASGGPVGLHNIRAGAVVAGSTDAVNGGQLADTNVRVAANTTAITNLTNAVSGSTVTAVQYSNATTPTQPNGGTLTNDVTLFGADQAAPVGLHNVAAGSVAAGSTDAVNGGQLFAVATQSANSIQYDRDATGARTNQVTLAGGNAAAPVTIANVAGGTVAAGSTQAVNGGQLYATNQTAQAALTLGQNSVQYDAGGGVTLGGTGGSPVALRNVAAGTAATDAVNVGQLQAGMRSAVAEATGYVDARLAEVGFDLGTIRRDMHAGSSAAMAVAALPQPMEPGATMIAIGGGTYRGQSAVAFGASRAFNDGRAVVKAGGTYDSRGYVGASAGVGFQF